MRTQLFWLAVVVYENCCIQYRKDRILALRSKVQYDSSSILRRFGMTEETAMNGSVVHFLFIKVE